MSRLNELTAIVNLAPTDLFYTRVGAFTDNDNRKITASDLQAFFDAGKSGGRTIDGGTGSGESLTLESTSHATKGYININAPLYMKNVAAASAMIVQSAGQTFGATFDPYLVFGYNYNGATATRINTADAASFFQLEGDYETTRSGTVHDSEFSYNVISTNGLKTRRSFGHSINRDNPDSWSVFSFGIHNASNGRVEIVDIANSATRIYDFRYDGFLTIATASPNISLDNGGASGKKHIRSNGTSLQVINSAYDTVIFSINDVGGVGIIGDMTITEAKNIVLGTTTGTKIGTGTTQKLALWNKTPNVQPTNAIAASAFVANTSLIANDTATFGGYTIGQITAALIRIGALA